MSLPIVEAVGLCKTYFGKIAVPVLRCVSFSVEEGEFVSIMGQSGSGKSTLLNLVGCLDRPTGGQLRVDGQDVTRLDEDSLARLRGDRLGFVFQYHFLLDEFTCLENALMPLLVRHGEAHPDDYHRVLGLLERVGLGKQRNQTPDTMSGGECQRCAIVRALANQPRLVLADEPTGNLDGRSGHEVFSLLREMNRETGVAVVMVTHDDRLARAADRILRIEDGQIFQADRADLESDAHFTAGHSDPHPATEVIVEAPVTPAAGANGTVNQSETLTTVSRSTPLAVKCLSA